MFFFNLNDIELDVDKRQQFIETYRDILLRVREEQDLSEFEVVKMKEHILEILDWVAKSEEHIKKEVHEMCGKIIRTQTDDIYGNGVESGQKELVINMYKNGMSADTIATMAQVSLETIKQWLSGTVKPAR